MTLNYEKHKDQFPEYGEMFHEYSKGRWSLIKTLRKRMKTGLSKITLNEFKEKEKKVKEAIDEQLVYFAKGFLRKYHIPYSKVNVRQVMGYISKEAHKIKAIEMKQERKEQKKVKGLEGKL